MLLLLLLLRFFFLCLAKGKLLKRNVQKTGKFIDAFSVRDHIASHLVVIVVVQNKKLKIKYLQCVFCKSDRCFLEKE